MATSIEELGKEFYQRGNEAAASATMREIERVRGAIVAAVAACPYAREDWFLEKRGPSLAEHLQTIAVSTDLKDSQNAAQDVFAMIGDPEAIEEWLQLPETEWSGDLSNGRPFGNRLYSYETTKRLAMDPRTRETYLARRAHLEKKNAEEEARRQAKITERHQAAERLQAERDRQEAEREANERRRDETFVKIVATWGSEAQRLAFAEDHLIHGEIIAILADQIFGHGERRDPRGFQAAWFETYPPGTLRKINRVASANFSAFDCCRREVCENAAIAGRALGLEIEVTFHLEDHTKDEEDEEEPTVDDFIAATLNVDGVTITRRQRLGPG